MDLIKTLAISAVTWPLITGAFTGLFVQSHRVAHRVCILGMVLCFLSTGWLAYLFMMGGQETQIIDLIQWSSLPSINAVIGLTIDALSITMLSMVALVALLIHIYSIGYMQDDIGYVRFFSLISLFSFAMLFLVATNNLIGLFFGWESISLFSYFLIGFYYYKDSAASANLKAFMINRFGDCAFCLGIVLLIYYVGGTAYADVYTKFDFLAQSHLVILGCTIKISTLVGALFFVGAMAKSAQIPLHIWLPDSMEGPTPVSALLHAATMVTAGVYLLARFGGMIEHALSLKAAITVIGATGALFLGMMALCETDIKRIIAFSTLSQLGYMMIAIGLGVYQIAIYHLVMHAFYKACLFMAAGSVILALRHEQNILKMGGLWSSMPITGLCFFLSALSLSGIPPFSGFYSKDLIMTAAHASIDGRYWGYYVYYTALAGCLVTPLYIFRLYWIVFFGKDNHHHAEVCESPWTVRLPMLILAALSVFAGMTCLKMFAGGAALNFSVYTERSEVFQNLNTIITKVVATGVMQHAIQEPTLIIALIGVIMSWALFRHKPMWMCQLQPWLVVPEYILRNQYGLDWVYTRIVVPFCIRCAKICQVIGEQYLINQTVEDRISKNMVTGAEKFSRVQTSYLNRYFGIMLAALGCLIGIGLLAPRLF